jgi:hypothetical protein
MGLFQGWLYYDNAFTSASTGSMTIIFNYTAGKAQKYLRSTSSVIFVLLVLSACAGSPEQTHLADKTACHVVYDAGSSGTRLYIYQQSAAGWLQHVGPQTGGLADPVLGNRGKSMLDAESVSNEIVGALKNMILDGPSGKGGQAKWVGFDWREQCNIHSAAVYGAGGMRLAEMNNLQNADVLWAMLNQKMSEVLAMPVSTRSLTGFEEGLYAWLAIRENLSDGEHEDQDRNNFGSTEMGGASAQVTFNCETCTASRAVLVEGEKLRIFSHSYQGQDEVWKKLGNQNLCKHGVGVNNSQWRVMDCTDGIVATKEFERDSKLIANLSGIRSWYLAGAFRYTESADIEKYCMRGAESSYQQESSCFRALYQWYFLNALGVPASSQLSDADWTLGAVLCVDESCMSFAGSPECEWSSGGCR